MSMTFIQDFDCQSRESDGRFAEVEVRTVVVFTPKGMSNIESIDTDALRSHIREGMERFVKFKKRETRNQDPKKNEP